MWLKKGRSIPGTGGICAWANARQRMGSLRKSFSSHLRAGLLALVFLALLLSGRAALAQNTYSCGDDGANLGQHCYANPGWEELPLSSQYSGSYVDIQQSGMKCKPSCDGHFSNEMWLTDGRTPACINNVEGLCWVEAGVEVQYGDKTVSYFWADSRPNQDADNTYSVHYLGPAAEDDPTHFVIMQDKRGGPNIYSVWIYNDSGSVAYEVESTPNNMSPNSVRIGTELSGTRGASGKAFFTHSTWFERSRRASPPGLHTPRRTPAHRTIHSILPRHSPWVGWLAQATCRPRAVNSKQPSARQRLTASRRRGSTHQFIPSHRQSRSGS
jgi:hypothetical protein